MATNAGKDSLNRIDAATERMDMGQLIDDILPLSSVTRKETDRASVDLSALVKAIVVELQKAHPYHQATFIIEEGITTHGDLNLFKLVLKYLIGNAWYFTSKRKNATIEFGTKSFDGSPAYFIRDNGAGFAVRLFGDFLRLNGPAELHGIEVGLATIQRIVNSHGGQIWAEGEVEKGATFYFTV